MQQVGQKVLNHLVTWKQSHRSHFYTDRSKNLTSQEKELRLFLYIYTESGNISYKAVFPAKQLGSQAIGHELKVQCYAKESTVEEQKQHVALLLWQEQHECCIQFLCMYFKKILKSRKNVKGHNSYWETGEKA